MSDSISGIVSAILKEAVGLHQQGKLQAAQERYRHVLAISPRQFDALHLLGVIARQSGQPALAVELITEAIDIDATRAQAHCNLGAALQDCGRTEDALASYELALKLQPQYDLAHCNRGNTLRKLGRADEALQSYERALEIRPHYPEASCNRAMLLQDMGRSSEALASAEQALAGRPNYADALCARGNALQGLDRFADAIESYERALAIKGDDAELYCALATALQRLHLFDEALQGYERAIRLKPDYAAAHQFRANTLVALGRKDDAVSAYRQALALGGNASQIGYALAALGAEPAPSSAPENYVKALFDQYAGHFDQHLVDVLDYQTPAILDAAIGRLKLANQLDTLDLGCGTGLCGPFLRARSRRLAGVDLSEKMLEKAAQRGIYDLLACADICAYLADKEAAFDLVVAADVFVYFGELATPFALVYQVMRPGAAFCFSVEQGLNAAFTLGASNRYAHSLAYIQSLAGATGFDVVEAEAMRLRAENGVAVTGYTIILRKPQ